MKRHPGDVLGCVQFYSRDTSGGQLGDTFCFLPLCLAQASACGGTCLLSFTPMDSTLCRAKPGFLNIGSELNPQIHNELIILPAPSVTASSRVSLSSEVVKGKPQVVRLRPPYPIVRSSPQPNFLICTVSPAGRANLKSPIMDPSPKISNRFSEGW